MYLIKKNSLVNGYSCHNFQFGCPTSSYISTEIYEHPSCTLIDSGCFQADQLCKSSKKYVHIQKEKNNWILVATLLGVFFILCVFITLTIYCRKKISYCKRNIDGENQGQEETLLINQCNEKNQKKGKFHDLQSRSDRLAVAAFDFGPSYLGYAFSWRTKWSEVKVNLPKYSGTIMQSEFPMTLLLNPDQSFCAFGYEAEDIFSEMEEKEILATKGFMEESCTQYYYFQKLTKFLHDKDKLHRDSIVKDRYEKPIKAMKIFSIFIKYLKDSLLETMNKDYKQNRISESDIDFVLLVPAVCGNGAETFMQEAAKNAGIRLNQLTVAFEEEVIAFYCQHMHLERHRPFPRQQYECVVVYIGGVGADVAVQIKQEKNGTFKGSSLASGGHLREISVDDEFEKFMETIGGEGIMTLFAENYMEEYLAMSKEFEEKKYVDLGSGSIVEIHVPISLHELIKQKYKGGLPEALKSTIYRESVTYKHSMLCIPFSVFKTFFQKAINNITKFIEEILTKTDTKNIIIISRFADCQIIQKSILENFKTHRVVIPPDQEFVVLKGAVYFGHVRNTTSILVSCYSFGVGMNQQCSSMQNEDNEQIDIEALPHGKTDINPLVRCGEEIELGSEYNFSHFLKTNLREVVCELYVSDRKDLAYTYKKDCKLLGNLLVQLPSETNSVGIKEGIVFSDTEITFRVTLDSGQIFEKSFDIFD